MKQTLLSTYSWARPCAKHFRSCITFNSPHTWRGRCHLHSWPISLEIVRTYILLKRKLRFGGLNALLDMTELISRKDGICIQVQLKQHYTKTWVLSFKSWKSAFWEEKKRSFWPPSLGFLVGNLCSKALVIGEESRVKLKSGHFPHPCRDTSHLRAGSSVIKQHKQRNYKGEMCPRLPPETHTPHTHNLHMHLFRKK